MSANRAEAVDHDEERTVTEGFDAARLRAAYLVQACPETVSGEFWHRTASDLLALALYASADQQGIVVSDVDLPALLAHLAEPDVHAWLAEPAAQVGLSHLAQMLAVPNRTREAVVQSACAVLASHRPETQPGVADEAAEELQAPVRRIGGHELQYLPEDRLWRCARCREYERAIHDPGTGKTRSCPPAS